MQARSDAQNWPDELDALIAAPKHHVLLFENETVRVLDTRVGPGETVPLHTHRWPSALYIMSWSDFVRRDAEGKVVADSRAGGKLPEGSAVWSGPLAPHTLENVGASELRAISVEVKSVEASRARVAGSNAELQQPRLDFLR
jgi:hypothetical protein